MAPLPVDAPAPGRRTLLIVDDEEGPRQSLRIVFEGKYDVLLAASGAQALELARHHPVDAAVLDIRMAGLSGVEVLGELKRHDPTIEVVMLTAFQTFETAQGALRLGACDYLTKPFELAAMREAVATAMQRKSLSEQISLNSRRLRALEEELHVEKMREEIARTEGDIYASVIHDLNSPITVISGFVELINESIAAVQRLEGEPLAEVRHHLAHITRQVTKCIDISRRYLSFLRHRSSGESSVNANQILNDLGELLKVHPKLKQNQLVVRPLPVDVTLAINGTDLLQILLNLAINALQSSAQPHRVEVHGRLLTQPLEPALFREDSQHRFINGQGFGNEPPLLELTVFDSGGGIPAGVMPKLFETRFTTKPAGEGTGLGLAIVRRFVTEAQGAIQVATQPGQGTRFTVYLPAHPCGTTAPR